MNDMYARARRMYVCMGKKGECRACSFAPKKKDVSLDFCYPKPNAIEEEKDKK
jgi:hypothetical protein